jgi:hypothetical protein
VSSIFDRERLAHSGLALALGTVMIMAVGCRTAPCPDGTVRDGDVCRRVPADAGSDEAVSEKVSPTRAAAAGSGNAGRAGRAGTEAKTGTAPKGAAGVNASDSAAAEESAGGSGAGAAKSESGGGGAKSQSPDAPAPNAPSPKQANAGEGAAGKKAAQAGSGGKAAAAQAGAGGESSAQTDEGGSSGSAGETAEPEAGSGGSEESGGAGGEPGGSTSFPNPQWTCLQVDASCVCVHAGSSAGDLCEEPRPTCCYLLPGATGNCICAPEGTQDCLTTGGNPGGMRVGQCPPPR